MPKLTNGCLSIRVDTWNPSVLRHWSLYFYLHTFTNLLWELLFTNISEQRLKKDSFNGSFFYATMSHGEAEMGVKQECAFLLNYATWRTFQVFGKQTYISKNSNMLETKKWKERSGRVCVVAWKELVHQGCTFGRTTIRFPTEQLLMRYEMIHLFAVQSESNRYDSTQRAAMWKSTMLCT